MLVLQGEGVELDVQRRRNPIWEWLFSHPVSSGAVFLAEMFSPIAANPIYVMALIFPGILYGDLYGVGQGFLAAFLVGIPVMVAASCLGKALEIAVVLRCAPRSRGALIGLIGLLGFLMNFLIFAGAVTIGTFPRLLAQLLQPLSGLPWPWLGLFLGQRSDGSFSLATGVLTCWSIAILVVATSVGLGMWAARQGLSGRVGRLDAAPRRMSGRVSFGKDPLYRKELMWFMRDRSALVQAILLPLAMASFQIFNLRGLLSGAHGDWNTLCGAAVLFGTYFLSVLGPKSLASEGAALWIPLTWPRGLESLLKAKAWLWTCLSSCVVGLILFYAATRFPAASGWILLVGIGWILFARSMAEKAVTLATVTGPSGESEKVPKGRAWATQLGTFTFAIGILTGQWSVAVAGIVYSYVTAAAMWQNFRARLPFLYDPWSERLPQAPTLMHAMIAISVLVEGGAVLTGVIAVVVGRGGIAAVQAVIYAACAVATSLVVARFLARRGVRPSEVWCWDQENRAAARFVSSLLTGIGLGLALGLFGRSYLSLLHHLPAAAEILDRSKAQMETIPYLYASTLMIAVLIAPVAEEYLFRGLLYRALDREWGGWPAVGGSAAFFAIYHPFLSWLPVFVVGVANAVIFKRTGAWLHRSCFT